jgi:sucrose-phosphate synthase
MTQEKHGLYIVLISIHGLVRGSHLELGRDADTGGQITYVIELARALAKHPGVERVDLLTRQVIDQKVDASYAQPQEQLCDGAYIIRVPCGPRRYLRKEVLWPHLDSFIDNALLHFRRVGMAPNLLHSHYADAGYAGARLSQLLGVPLFHTGHSLGRVKRQRMLAHGTKPATIESQYNINQRIEAEEIALGNASLIIASTKQEVEEQYSQYENYHPRRMIVLPPGTDLSRFHPPPKTSFNPPIKRELARFLVKQNKPMILALSRADERKNIHSLVHAYATHPGLRELANLVVIAGNRDEIKTMEKGPRNVLNNLLLLIDKYDLYGSVAYPKQHTPDDIPQIYQLAAKNRGVFINPALTEPFGLTLIEAAASGLPIIATEDGGPRDIIEYCKNGILIDPLDIEAIGHALYEALTDKDRWQRWSKNGIRGANRHFSWESHVDTYLKLYRKLHPPKKPADVIEHKKSRLPSIDRLLVCDIDNTLLGDKQGLNELMHRIHTAPFKTGFALATGRRLESVLDVIKKEDLPTPDILITSVGSEIYYGHRMLLDSGWQRHINYRWQPEALQEAMKDLPGVTLQPKIEQRKFKLSYYIDPKKAPKFREIQRHLRRLDLHAKLVYSHGAYLDLVPIRGSKGMAIRYLALKWGLAAEHILVAGDSGNDEEMLGGNTLAVVVGNYSPELEHLRGKPHVYFAQAHHAWGIIEGIDEYQFLSDTNHLEEEESVEFLV